MKESKLYLQFLRNYLSYFLIASLLFTTLGALIELQKPTKYQLTRILEIDENSANIQDKTLQVQETVSLVRSSNVQQDLGVVSTVTVFNNSPLTITTQVVSNNRTTAESDQTKLTHYIQGKFLFHVQGTDVTTVLYPKIWLGGLLGFVIGNFATLAGVLVLSYFKKY